MATLYRGRTFQEWFQENKVCEHTSIGTVFKAQLKDGDNAAQVVPYAWLRFVFRYKWVHLPTGKSGIHKVFVECGERGFLALLQRWNCSDDWVYAPISPEGS